MPKEATATATRTRTTKSTTRKKKDPNAPKRPMTAYMFYANEQREPTKTKHPELSFGEVHKLIGEEWHKLSESEKKPYEEKAAAAKKRYEEEKAAYKAST